MSILAVQRVLALSRSRLPNLLHGKAIFPVKAFTSDVKSPLTATTVPKPLPTTLFNIEFPSFGFFPKYLDTEQKRLLNEFVTSLGQPARAALDELNAPCTGMLEVDVRLRKGPIQRRCWIDSSDRDVAAEARQPLDELIFDEFWGEPIEMPCHRDWAKEDDIKLWTLSQIHLVKMEDIAEQYFLGWKTVEECRARRDALAESDGDYAWDVRDQAVREYDRLQAMADDAEM
ncbi:hypothetical protein HDU87_005262 [Geranomyces variabilis]|uniref:Uncharacterized protein n=1 Tax=Geranomyces variabilis TaxID=109894 RepID=A0AAD5THK1_9FUNG|nr:hypothetical protein HDU87_005262 [Geranomyces variabilis]